MDYDALVNEIASRVAAQLEKQPEEPVAENGALPKLLILTQSHGTHCHELLESDALRGRCTTVCALTEDYSCDLDGFETVVLYDLDLPALVKIADGCGDTPYTCLAVRAILSGKRVFAVREEIELFDYESTAPAAYYQALLHRVELLKQSGVRLVGRQELTAAVLEEKTPGSEPVRETGSRAFKTVSFSKKAISERDAAAAYADGATEVQIGQKSILTDLAREYFSSHNVRIVRA